MDINTTTSTNPLSEHIAKESTILPGLHAACNLTVAHDWLVYCSCATSLSLEILVANGCGITENSR